MYMRKIIVEEFNRLYSNFYLIVMLIGLPIFFTIAFGFAYSKNVVNYISLTICDEDQSSLSRNLISMYDDSEKFRIVSYVETEEAVHREIYDGRAKSALIIPKNFSRNVKAGKDAEVLFIGDVCSVSNSSRRQNHLQSNKWLFVVYVIRFAVEWFTNWNNDDDRADILGRI